MTNKFLFIANWKMFGDLKTIKTVDKVIKFSKKKENKNIKIIYCPPYTLLDGFVKITKSTKVDVGAQDSYFEKTTGPFTGSISPDMIKKLGVKYVIIGHSEKRKDGDTDKIVNKKIINALSSKLYVILCIGETIKEKNNNKTKYILRNQLNSGLKNITNIKNIIIAYEPIWSIGTGKILTNKELIDNFLFLKKYLKLKFRSKKPIIIYGGSVNNKNISDLKEINEIDGFLVGGASTNYKKFIDIMKKTIN